MSGNPRGHRHARGGTRGTGRSNNGQFTQNTAQPQSNQLRTNLPHQPNYGQFRGDRGNRSGRGGPSGPNIYNPAYPALPSETVRKAENDNIVELSQKPGALTDQGIPVRPGYGQIGRPIVLRTNYFEISFPGLKAITVYRYSVDVVDPNPPPKKHSAENADSDSKDDGKPGARKLRRLMTILLQDGYFEPFRPGLATNYSDILLTTQKLDLGDQHQLVMDVRYQDEIGETAVRQARIFRATISKEKVVPVAELLAYIGSAKVTQLLGERLPIIEALNSIVARAPSILASNFSRSKNSKFYSTTSDSLAIGSGLTAIRGIFSSVRPSTNRLLLNVNVTTSAFFDHNISLGQIMKDFMKDLGHNNPDLRIEQLEKFIAKRRIQTTYQGATKTHTIQGLANELKENTRISNPRGGTAETLRFEGVTKVTTVQQYFLERYHVRLESPKLPCINTSTDPKKPRYIPPELCHVLPGQAYGKKLSASQTRSMLGFAAVGPVKSAEEIIKGADMIMRINAGNEVLDAFGIRIEPKLLAVEARILDPPTVVYQTQISRPRDEFSPKAGKWNIEGHKFKSVVKLPTWAVLKVPVIRAGHTWDSSFGGITVDVIKHFGTVIKNAGLGETVPSIYTLNLEGDRSLGQDAENDRRIKEKMESLPKDIEFLFVILSNKDQFIYSRIKFYADVKIGIHCVCATTTKFGMNKADIFANIAHKINLKLGGVNHGLGPKQLGPLLAGGTTMIVGIDVTHPSPGSIENSPSIAAVVASTNGEFAHFPASLRTQTGRVEMVEAIENMMFERLNLWRAINGRFPAQIIIYRDGVSESQYQTVLSEEFAKIQLAYGRCYTNQQWPKTAIIVVGKRHHTRFYATRVEHATRNSNTVNGTVVDRGVTMDRGWDFFLQAHDSLQGTARPAHYVVILNEFGKDLSPDALERMTHNLCYLFGRATKAVSICPPAYYADLACERGRCYLNWHTNSNPGEGKRKYVAEQSPWVMWVHDNVKRSMFYI